MLGKSKQVRLQFTQRHLRANRGRAGRSALVAPRPNDPPTPVIIPGYEIIEYQGIVGPGNLPRAVVTRLNGDIVKSLAAPDLRERFVTSGAYIAGGTPEEFADYIRKQIAAWGKVIKAAGIKLD